MPDAPERDRRPSPQGTGILVDMAIVLETPRPIFRQFSSDDVSSGIIEGSEHGEVEYALTRPEWRARTEAAVSG
jgi:hypothetical protein